MALHQIYDYFHNYDKQTYQVVACMGNEPSEDDVKSFEESAGVTLPAEFREFMMSPLGGLYMNVREEIWPRAKEHDELEERKNRKLYLQSTYKGFVSGWENSFQRQISSAARDISNWLLWNVNYVKFI